MREENIEKMNFKELRNEVQYLRDELAMFKRKFNDIIYNLDSDNFGKSFTVAQNNMKTQIKINAQEIATKVSEDDLERELSVYSEISETASAIRTLVSKNVNISNSSNVREVNSWPDLNADPDYIYVVRTRYGSNVKDETYYYYSSFSNQWETLTGNNIYTVFNQTAYGFELKGNVSVDGSVVADSLQGETITGTAISGSTINGSTITGGNIYTGLFSCADDATRTSAKNKIRIDGYSVDYLRFDDDNSLLPYFKVSYGDSPNYTSDVVEFSATTKGKHFLRVEPTAPQNVTSYTGNNVGYVIPYGTWNFSQCNIDDWGNNAPSSVAVFG